MKMSDVSPNRSFMQFYWNDPNVAANEGIGIQGKSMIYEKYYDSSSDGVEEGICEKKIDSAELDSSISRFYIEASINGPLENTGLELTQKDQWCYAYSFHPIEFEYDYDDGKCYFEVSVVNLLKSRRSDEKIIFVRYYAYPQFLHKL